MAGAWLKQRRKEQGIGPDQFADLIGCSAITLLKIEAGDAPSFPASWPRLLAERLQVPPDELRAIYQHSLAWARVDSAEPASEVAARTPWRATAARRQTCPRRLLPLWARRGLAEARELLLQPRVRLLTLTGAPGIGKTRLALQVAADLLDVFEDGVFLVEISPDQRPRPAARDNSTDAGAEGRGAQPLEDLLLKRLSERRTLLVLDNFEHLLDAAPSVVRLLEGSPLLKMMATSREALHVRGERRLPVPPLTIPESVGHSPLDQGARRSIRRSRSSLTRGRQSPGLYADGGQCRGRGGDMCRAGRITAGPGACCGSLQAVLPRRNRASLKSRLNLLTGGERDLPLRQRTLRSAIGWSYGLLNKEEQQLLRLLGTFVGGFTSEAAAAVCESSAGDVQELLTALVDKNLVRREVRAGETRYAMLEVIREYAAANARRERGGGRCKAALRSLLSVPHRTQAYSNQTGPRQLPLLMSMDADYSNLIAGLGWLLSNGHHDPATAEMAALMASYLFYYWDWHGYFAEGRGGSSKPWRWVIGCSGATRLSQVGPTARLPRRPHAC